MHKAGKAPSYIPVSVAKIALGVTVLLGLLGAALELFFILWTYLTLPAALSVSIQRKPWIDLRNGPVPADLLRRPPRSLPWL